MKAIKCEMCDSNDVIKDGDYFVCQSCGTKYTVEAAKKLMIEVSGTVDVSGSTVVVDNSSFVEKCLANARRARAKEDWEECEKYYNLVEQYEPNNIEAIFYSSYGKAKMAMVEADRFKREQKVKVLKNSISVIDDNYDYSEEKYEENKQMIEQINADLMALVKGEFVYNTTTTKSGTTSDRSYTYSMFVDLCLGWIESLNNIVQNIPAPKDLYIYRLIRQNYEYVFAKTDSFDDNYDLYKSKINSIDQIIKGRDPNYQPPQPQKSGGCYVATCVYGSYDCPQVWTLRRYRDDTLAETWYGRAFIRTYYAISPTLVKRFGHTRWFKKMWHGKLDRMVKKLNDKGVENTPYKDKNW